jgi:branched-chain amino acid transport system permease protein
LSSEAHAASRRNKTASAWREGLRDAAAAFNRPTTWAVIVVIGAAAFAPLVISSQFRISAMAAGLYVALAAVGLNFAVGMAGMASLGQGAFVGIGAFGAALLRVKTGWDPVTAAAGGAALASVAGVVVGAGAIRLRGPFVAVATWIFSWLVALALVAFPSISGGSQGLALPVAGANLSLAGGSFRLTPGVHYEVALALLAITLLAFAVLAHGPAGLALSAARQAPPAARTLGVKATHLQRGAFAVAAALGGLAGALGVQLAGVADTTAYGTLLSVELFVAVLLGGEGTVFGPLLGATVLAVIPRVAGGLGSAAGIAAERFEPVLAAAILLVALIVGRGGLLGLLHTLRGRRQPATAVPTEEASRRGEPGPGKVPPAPLVLEAEGLAKRFQGLAALDGVSVRLARGEVRALIGPNGSGKTTCLRILAGTMRTDGGRIVLEGRDLTVAPTPERVRAGIVRTLPTVTLFTDLTVLQHAVVGTLAGRRYSGMARTMLATPLCRSEAAARRRAAQRALEAAGLEPYADRPVRSLSPIDQRLLILATAYASSPKVLMLDEPSAGLSPREAQRVVALLNAFRAEGTALLLVEHNLRVVGALADRVTVLDAGVVIAEGTVGEITRNPAVREAYLGPSVL